MANQKKKMRASRPLVWFISDLIPNGRSFLRNNMNTLKIHNVPRTVKLLMGAISDLFVCGVLHLQIENREKKKFHCES